MKTNALWFVLGLIVGLGLVSIGLDEYERVTRWHTGSVVIHKDQRFVIVEISPGDSITCTSEGDQESNL